MTRRRLFWKFLLRSFANDKRRSANIVTSIGLATSVFILLLFSTQSFQKSWSNFYDKKVVDIIITEKNRVEPFTSSIPAEVVREMGRFPGIARASGVLLDVGSYKDTTFVVFGYGQDSLYYDALGARGGGPASGLDVLVSEPFAETYGLHEGGALKIYGKTMRVAGLYEAKDLLESNSVVLDVDTLRGVKSMGEVASFVGLKIAPGADAQAVLQALETRFEATNLQPFLSGSFGNKSKMFKKITAFGTLITAFSYFLIILTTMNTLSRYIIDHQLELTMLRITGWSKGQIARMIVCESLLFSLTSLLAGMALALAALYLITRFGVIDFISLSDLDARFFAQAAVFVLASSLAGIGKPLARLFKLDPGSVFKNA